MHFNLYNHCLNTVKIRRRPWKKLIWVFTAYLKENGFLSKAYLGFYGLSQRKRFLVKSLQLWKKLKWVFTAYPCGKSLSGFLRLISKKTVSLSRTSNCGKNLNGFLRLIPRGVMNINSSSFLMKTAYRIFPVLSC